MLDEALRIEDLHLSYRGLIGTTFSKPRALGYFESGIQPGEQELISGANLVLKKGETLCIGGASGQGKSASFVITFESPIFIKKIIFSPMLCLTSLATYQYTIRYSIKTI